MVCLLLVGCRNYSRYALDDKPTVKLDSSLCGIWKCAEDTDKSNFILVQTYDDLESEPPNSTESSADFMRRNGADIKDQDTSAYNKAIRERVEEIEQKMAETRKYSYYFTYFNAHGKNPCYQAFTAFESFIQGIRFLNISYYNQPLSPEGVPIGENETGYLLLRLLRVSNKSIVTAMILDTTLKNAGSAAEVRKKVTKNLNNIHYYSDTMHFYKVNDYHIRLYDAPKHAN